MDRFAYTSGVLDACDWRDGQLRLAGWIAGCDRPVTELRVMVSTGELGRVRAPFLPSPDVAAAWPGLQDSANCRFEARFAVERKAVEGTVVSLIPLAGGVPGVPLERFVSLKLKPPTAAEADLVGGGDFLSTSFEFLSLFRLLAGLRPDEAVLDAGCGLGRMAFGLAHYLSPRGRYEGFDVSETLVSMARARMGPMANFRFRHVDIANAMYNPGGRVKASDFVFPFGSGEFDFAFLTSVFTHMLPSDVENYLRELRRVLKAGGRALATFFVMDEAARSNVQDGVSRLDLSNKRPDGCWVKPGGAPEEAIAYPQEVLLRMVEGAGLKIAQSHPGSWSGRRSYLTYQDVLVLEPR